MIPYTLTFAVTREGITPSEVQTAGFFGDKQAVILRFEPDASLGGDFRYRLEINDGGGGYDVSELLELTGGAVEYPLPTAWTVPGVAEVRLCVLRVDEQGAETFRFYSAPARLSFADREDGGDGSPVMLPRWQETMTRVETVAESLETAAKDGAFVPTFSVGEVTTGEPAVSISGEGLSPVLHFSLPEGEKGEPGEPGERGESGLVPIGIPQVTVEGTTSVYELPANTVVPVSAVATDTVRFTLGTPLDGYDNEWAFTLTQGDTAKAVELPQVHWGLGIAPVFGANSVTQCRMYYLGDTLCGEWVAV